MDLTVQHFNDCPNWLTTIDQITGAFTRSSGANQ